ncbi:MAG: hypothetical protein WAZ27_01930 [Minisyncoccia bacterium]
MVNKISTWGMAAIIVYTISVGFLFMYTTNCQGSFCGAGIVLAMLPWAIFFEDGLQTPFFELDGMAWFWTIVILNALILYFIFAKLQKWMHR